MDSVEAYESKAAEFLHVRDRSTIGAAVVAQWGCNLQECANVLELGCGGGYPITRTLHEMGLQLNAIESSPTLVSVFRSRFPDIPVQCAKVQESPFFNQSYDGVIAIGLLFLLSEPEQLAVISRVAKVLHPGGRFLFTSPKEKGSWIDVNTNAVCRSLGQATYEGHLRVAGFRLLDTCIDSGKNNYYDVERIG